VAYTVGLPQISGVPQPSTSSHTVHGC